MSKMKYIYIYIYIALIEQICVEFRQGLFPGSSGRDFSTLNYSRNVEELTDEFNVFFIYFSQSRSNRICS